MTDPSGVSVPDMTYKPDINNNNNNNNIEFMKLRTVVFSGLDLVLTHTKSSE